MGDHQTYRLLEFVALFVIVPLAAAQRWIRIPLIPLLWTITVGCGAALWWDPSFDRSRFWRMGDPLWMGLGLAILVPVALALLVIVRKTMPEGLFYLPRNQPAIWLKIMVLYPLLSVYPQGIVYRGFIFHRYADLFPSHAAMVAVSALAFSFMHIVFRNRVAPLLTLLGGLLFAVVYDGSGSLVASAIVHAALGAWIFTVGLGEYFYSEPPDWLLHRAANVTAPGATAA